MEPVRSTSQADDLGLGVGPPDPEPGRLGLGEPVGEVAHVGDLEMLDSAGGGLAGGGGDGGRAPLRHHHPGRPRELGRAADGTEVARVLHLVERDQQRVFPAQQPPRIPIGIRIDLSHDALVVGRPTEPLQLQRIRLRRPPDPVHLPPPPFRLLDRLLPVDDLVGHLSLGHQARARRGIPHFPAHLRQLVSNCIGARKVLGSPRCLPLLHQGFRRKRPRPRPVQPANRGRATRASRATPSPPHLYPPCRDSLPRPAQTPRPSLEEC